MYSGYKYNTAGYVGLFQGTDKEKCTIEHQIVDLCEVNQGKV